MSRYQAELATVKLHANHPMFGEEFLSCPKFPIVAARGPFKGDDTPYFRDSLRNCFGSIKQLFKQGNMGFKFSRGFPYLLTY